MSALFVGADHIDAMLTAIRVFDVLYGPVPSKDRKARGSLGSDETLTEIGKALLAENVKSLRARYPSFRKENGEHADSAARYRFKYDKKWAIRSDVAIATVKLCDCYDYQACEHDGWERSFAKRFTSWLARSAAQNVPGYLSAPWGF